MAKAFSNGYWMVKKGDRQWHAWERWLKAECGFSFVTDPHMVLFEYPPATEDGLDLFIRDTNKIRERCDLSPLPDGIRPWRPVSPVGTVDTVA